MFDLPSLPHKNEDDQLVAEVTREEYDTIMGKLCEAARRPAGHLLPEETLYLEQQVSDLLGCVVTSELESHRLMHSVGVMGSHPHLKRYPTDTLEQHDAVVSAGLASHRSFFGWFTENGQLTPTGVTREQYHVAVPLTFLPEWSSHSAELNQWYKFRKVVVVNPAEHCAVVAVVGDIGPGTHMQRQFTGSPEVIIAGKVWSPKSLGHVIVWFVDDPNDHVPLGPINCSYELVQQRVLGTTSGGAP